MYETFSSHRSETSVLVSTCRYTVQRLYINYYCIGEFPARLKGSILIFSRKYNARWLLVRHDRKIYQKSKMILGISDNIFKSCYSNFHAGQRNFQSRMFLDCKSKTISILRKINRNSKYMPVERGYDGFLYFSLKRIESISREYWEKEMG